MQLLQQLRIRSALHRAVEHFRGRLAFGQRFLVRAGILARQVVDIARHLPVGQRVASRARAYAQRQQCLGAVFVEPGQLGAALVQVTVVDARVKLVPEMFLQLRQQFECGMCAAQVGLGDQRFAQPHRGLQVFALLGQHAAGQLDHTAPVGHLQFVLPVALGKARVVGTARLADLVEGVAEADVVAARRIRADRPEPFGGAYGHRGVSSDCLVAARLGWV